MYLKYIFSIYHNIKFSSVNDLLISTSKDSKAILWNSDNGDLLYELIGHTDKVIIADFNFDSTLWATGSLDMKILLWSIDTGDILKSFDSFIGSITWIEFSKDDNLFLSCSADATWRIYNADNLELIYLFTDHMDEITSASWGNWNEVKFIATASADQTINIYTTEYGEIWYWLRGHTDKINKIWINNRQNLLISASNDRTWLIWSIITGEWLQCLNGFLYDVVWWQFNLNGDVIITGWKNTQVLIWKLSL